MRSGSKLFFVTLLLPLFVRSQQTSEADICIYGGSSAGVIAAYTAVKMKKSVIIIEPGTYVGGLSSGGLGYTDIGNKYAITGLSRDFYRRIGQYYGKFEQWIFEPHVAEDVFKQYLRAAKINVWYKKRLTAVDKQNGNIRSITIESLNGGKQTVKAKVFMDCTYEGDLMAMAGVSYTIGREANNLYGETYNGVQLMDKHQFPDGIDPYKIPGQPSSGLLWGISSAALDPAGTGDKKVQAYNFRICLTNKPENRVEITRPAGYDSTKYELLLRYLEKKPAKDLWGFLKFDLMPNGKTDINNWGPFSTDMIGMNYSYPEAGYAEREKIYREHETYTKGLLYFAGHDARIPEHIRQLMLQWGYPKDEYKDNGHWSPQMYVREARRMIGAYVMTQANCQGKEVVTDTAGFAAYTMDSHNCQRIVVNGMVKNEGDVQIGGFGPYPISYRSIIPKKEECGNLFVPVCLSASHIAYGSIRMEPVFMVLGQSAAVAASLAIDAKKAIQEIDVKKMQQVLRYNPLADGSTPEILVDNEDPAAVKTTGEWKKETAGAYGPSMHTAQGNGALIRFTPAVQAAGTYHLYTYLPKLKGLSSSITVRIYDGKKTTTHIIKEKEIRVEGQTSGEWVDLGRFTLPKGRKAYAEISSDGADGVVVGDAVLFIRE